VDSTEVVARCEAILTYADVLVPVMVRNYPFAFRTITHTVTARHADVSVSVHEYEVLVSGVVSTSSAIGVTVVLVAGCTDTNIVEEFSMVTSYVVVTNAIAGLIERCVTVVASDVVVGITHHQAVFASITRNGGVTHYSEQLTDES
jgi:hypothetical protein